MTSFAAGRIGERLKFGDAPTDQEVAWRVGTRPELDAELLQALPRLMPNEDPAKLREEAEVKAELILRKRWSDVLKVAAELEQRSRLTGAEFYALLGKNAPSTEPIVQVRKATMPLMVRSATLNAANNSEVDLIWTTGASVRRSSYDGPYDEVLETGEGNVRLGRLNAGAPLLNSHDASDLSRVLGSVVPGSARMVNGQGVARIKLSARAEVAGLVQDIVAGVIRNVSVGYKYHRVEIDKSGDIPEWRVTDWEPMEISAVAIGADGFSQFRHGESFECEVRG